MLLSVKVALSPEMSVCIGIHWVHTFLGEEKRVSRGYRRSGNKEDQNPPEGNNLPQSSPYRCTIHLVASRYSKSRIDEVNSCAVGQVMPYAVVIYQVEYLSINTKQETASIHRVIGTARFRGDIEA